MYHYIIIVLFLIVSLVSNVAFADDPVASGDEQAVVALEPTASASAEEVPCPPPLLVRFNELTGSLSENPEENTRQMVEPVFQASQELQADMLAHPEMYDDPICHMAYWFAAAKIVDAGFYLQPAIYSKMADYFFGLAQEQQKKAWPGHKEILLLEYGLWFFSQWRHIDPYSSGIDEARMCSEVGLVLEQLATEPAAWSPRQEPAELCKAENYFCYGHRDYRLMNCSVFEPPPPPVDDRTSNLDLPRCYDDEDSDTVDWQSIRTDRYTVDGLTYDLVGQAYDVRYEDDGLDVWIDENRTFVVGKGLQMFVTDGQTVAIIQMARVPRDADLDERGSSKLIYNFHVLAGDMPPKDCLLQVREARPRPTRQEKKAFRLLR